LAVCAQSDEIAPENLPIASTLRNPAVPDTLLPSLADPSPVAVNGQRTTTSPNFQFVGTGPERRFLTPWEQAEATPGYPARPTAGSIMDLDLVDERCNFGSGKVCSLSHD
jgi:WD repeat and SOF domain-containing protein 1